MAFPGIYSTTNYHGVKWTVYGKYTYKADAQARAQVEQSKGKSTSIVQEYQTKVARQYLLKNKKLGISGHVDNALLNQKGYYVLLVR